MSNKRMSLKDFKNKEKTSKNLEKISGGILGACHCKVVHQTETCYVIECEK